MIIYNRTGVQVGETFTLDTTLSEQGQAADAKATGASVTDCYAKLDPEIWENRIRYGLITEYGTFPGTINSEGVYVPGTSGVVSDFIPVSVGTTYSIRNFDYVYAYDADKQYISYTSQKYYTCPADVSFVRITTSNAKKESAQIVEMEHRGEPNINGYIYTGVTENADVLIRKGVNSFADRNGLYFAKSRNQFNYEEDWVQYSGGGEGLSRTDGTFIYNGTANSFSSQHGVCPIKYFEVQEGQTLTANRRWMYGAYYDENKEHLGNIGDQNSNHPSFVAPTGCAYVRLAFYPMESVEDVKGLTVYAVDFEVENKRTSVIENPVPTHQINGDMISNNYLDKVVPTMKDSQLLSAMKCLAIREANSRDHAVRIGNFNMYVGNYDRGWDLTKKMLMDFGVDICGFEEVTTANVDLAAFLQSWQFPDGFYTNKTDGEAVIDKSLVSRYKVESSSKLYYVYNNTNLAYLNCKIKLPRLLDVANPYRTLSVYVVHLSITTSEYKAQIASQIIAAISQDTSDYVIVFGDMNDMGTTEETKTYWRTFEAGGLRPVLPITSKTITDDENEVRTADDYKKMALDQFCVSSNIDVVRYGIVNTKDGYGDANVQKINNDPCLSDHDFVWIDAVFKDEARTVPNN